MEFNIISILDIAGVIQGLVMGVLLIILNKSKYKSTFYLGLFLILFTLQRIPNIAEEVGFFNYYPELYRLPFNFFWLLFPLFCIYTQQVHIFNDQKIKYEMLYPGIAAFVFQVIIFFQPYEVKLNYVNSIWYLVFIFSGLVYGWAIAIKNINIISHHQREVNNQFSMVARRELKWAKTFLYFAVWGSILYIIQRFMLPENIYSRIFFLGFDLIAIYWLSYHGVVQRNVLSILNEKDLYKSPKNVNEKSVVAISDDTSTNSLKKIMQEINIYMQNSESFTSTELTIIDLAKSLKIHPKRISTAINKIEKQNFNSYINKLRVKKAQELLLSTELQNLSIEGIGHEVGFHSKSAFYAAFKKIVGTTPTKYKIQNAA